MKYVETDFGVIPVEDDSYDDLHPGGPLYQDMVNELDKTFQYYPVFESVSVVNGRIGLWNNGDERKFIRFKFTADYAAPTGHSPNE